MRESDEKFCCVYKNIYEAIYIYTMSTCCFPQRVRKAEGYMHAKVLTHSIQCPFQPSFSGCKNDAGITCI